MGEGNSKPASPPPSARGNAPAQGAISTPTTGDSAAAQASYEAEKARMMHLRTSDEVEEDRSQDYHMEADRLIDIYRHNLPKSTPPLIRAAVQEQIVGMTRKEKMNDEILHHSQIFSPNRIPSDGILRTLAQFQTMSMREGIAVHKVQEEINFLLKQVEFQVHTLATCAHQELLVLNTIESSLMEAERLRQDVNMLESLVDDIVPIVEEIDALMTEDEKREVKTGMR